MGRCSYGLLIELEPALEEIRKLKDLEETKPGIFYFKSQGFMHFHEKNGKIWADVRDGKGWGKPIDIPQKVTKASLSKFVNQIVVRYFACGGDPIEKKKESTSTKFNAPKTRVKNASQVAKN